LTAALILAACTSTPVEVTRPPAVDVALHEDLGRFHRAVSTTSQATQRYFDQGLVLAYGFNHDEAERSFQQAAHLDPSCAMAWWGIAYVNGPHINNPTQDPERASRALAALANARACEGKSDVEEALIEALARRYSADPKVERAALDEAYAQAMADVWERFPHDADVGALYAEALMNVHPWDLWTSDGKPKNDVEKIVATLDGALTVQQDHPHANHLYIHAVEASPNPDRAVPAADRLRALVPGSSHLVHMPSHIDVRTGRFAEASLANERAIEVDRKHRASVPAGGFYQVYMAHNRHMLAFSSMMEGRSKAALEAARAMVAEVPAEFLAGPVGPAIDGLMPVVLHVLVRFGRWEEVLAEPEFAPGLRSSNAVRHYARGVALGALGRLDEAGVERQALADAINAMDERPIGNNPAKQVLLIPLAALEGELLFRRGQAAQGIARLREAVAMEDQLLYDEPPDWMTPARHALAATLMAAGQHADAEAVLRDDLNRFPENGWALVGLARCLRARGAEAEAAHAEERFRAAWARADVEITTPCLCQPGGG
jgi:tetratricopeptide (TPR) repeat protein